MPLSEKLKQARLKANLSQAQLAEKLGLNVRTYGSYERGERDVSTALLRNICEVLNVSSDELLEHTPPAAAPSLSDLYEKYDNISPVQLKRFPLLGEIACGEPIFVNEDKESFVMADMDIKADFCLKAKGDSMINSRINDGDIVFIQSMPIVDDGEIAAVIIEDEATLKRVYYYREENKLMLVAENPKYKPLVYTNEELEQIHILGKAVYFMSAL